MRSEKCEARSRTLVGVVSGTFLERQASTSYTVISLVISMSKLKTTIEKNSRLDVYLSYKRVQKGGTLPWGRL